MGTGKENLVPFSERTEDEQREIAKNGGVASCKARRQKRTMKEAAEIILKAPANDEQTELLKKYGIPDQDCTKLLVIMAKAVQMASEGNLKAAQFIRDTLGENPQYRIYEKRLEYLIADKQAPHTLSDDWVEAILKTSEEA